MLKSPRLVPCLAVLTATGLALGACSGDRPADAVGELVELSNEKTVEIVFESYNLGTAGAWTDTTQGLIDRFNADHPNIKVTGQAGDSAAGVAQSVQKQLLAGQAPEVAQIIYNELDYAINELGAANLTELVGQAGLDEHFGGEYPFHERARVLSDRNGSTYGIPYVFSTPVLWVNETKLAEAGIDPATVDLSTWEAVSAVGAKVSETTGAPSISLACVVTGGNWCMQALFKSNGASVLSADRATIEFGSDEAVEVVATFQQMFQDGILTNEDSNSMYESAARGDVALHVNTSAVQHMLMAGAEAGGWTLNATTLPAFGDKPVVPTNSGSTLMIFTEDPEKRAAAWEFIKFMTSPAAYEQITTKIGYLPLRTSMTEEGGPLAEWVGSNPLVKPNLAQLDSLSPWVAYPGSSYQQVDTVLATAIEDAIFYGADPAEAMREAAQRAQELIEG
ncbi:MAG: extracellular solute-binding protein [Bifidobacteriaceae bacterium]|jgi:multiple sugar transport system substrate-binding protein|nr:extracellular solute-binding protein [Bifidobacteriaceae bacterium]